MNLKLNKHLSEREGNKGIRMRGKPFHNYLVDQAGKAFHDAGCAVDLEYPQQLPDGRFNFIDILAVRDGIALACEVETTTSTVLSNVQKALLLQLPLWIIVPNRETRLSVARKLRHHLNDRQRGPIWISLPDELSQGLSIYFSSANQKRKNKKINNSFDSTRDVS